MDNHNGTALFDGASDLIEVTVEELGEDQAGAGNCFGTLGSAGCPACFGTLGSFT